MSIKRLAVPLVALWLSACSSSDGPEGSLEVAVGNSPVTLPVTGTADISLTLSNTGGEPVIVDLCSDRIAASLQEQIDNVWVQAGANSCSGSERRSVEIGASSSISTAYALTRPGTFRLQVPFRNGAGDFSETTSASFQAVR